MPLLVLCGYNTSRLGNPVGRSLFIWPRLLEALVVSLVAISKGQHGGFSWSNEWINWLKIYIKAVTGTSFHT